MYKLLFFTFIFSFIVKPAAYDAQARKYDRCYMLLVSEVPQKNDPFLRRIKQGSLNATQACMKLLSQAQFSNSDREIEKITSTSDLNKKAFNESLYKYTREKNCQSCHNSSHSKPHSSGNIAQALTSASSLVDFNNVDNSKIYTKIKNGHRCSGEECSETAQRIKNEIINWRDDLKFYNDYLYTDFNGKYNKIGIEILRNFNNFHRRWFSVDNPYNVNGIPGVAINMQDMNEQAYYFLRSIFTDKPISDVLTTHKSLEAVRYSKYPVNPYSVIKRNGVEWTDIPFAPRGRLVGVKLKDDYIKTDVALPVHSKFRSVIKLGDPVNFTANLGGGIIGTQAFLAYNTIDGKYDSKSGASDGGLHMYRRWSEAVYKGVLCRDLPVVRNDDVSKYVKFNSDMPFRAGKACMGCHVTMDKTASMLRNHMPTRVAAQYALVSVSNTPTLASHPHETGETNGVKNWIDQADEDYWKRPPNGKFFFRDYKGFLHNKDLTGGLRGLGEHLAQVDDFYMCTVKRYVNFFTGVNIPIFDPDPTSSSTPQLTTKEKEYYDFIEKLALELKDHQDVTKTLERIFDSQAFVLPGKGVE